MQQVSVSHRVKVQYLAVSGEQSVDNAVPYFNGLAQQKCAVIVAPRRVTLREPAPARVCA